MLQRDGEGSCLQLSSQPTPPHGFTPICSDGLCCVDELRCLHFKVRTSAPPPSLGPCQSLRPPPMCLGMKKSLVALQIISLHGRLRLRIQQVILVQSAPLHKLRLSAEQPLLAGNLILICLLHIGLIPSDFPGPLSSSPDLYTCRVHVRTTRLCQPLSLGGARCRWLLPPLVPLLAGRAEQHRCLFTTKPDR